MRQLLKQEFLELEQQLHHTPSSKEMTRFAPHSARCVAQYFGSWDNFIEEMKDVEREKPKPRNPLIPQKNIGIPC